MNDNDTNPESESPDASAPEPGAGMDEAASDAAAAGGAGRVAELEAQVADLRDQVLRAMAETENMRKRSERHVQDAHKFAVTQFARDILQVADNLERALEAVPEERRGEHELLGVLAEGVQAVQAAFVQVMGANHIERIDPEGQPFDPNLHEAMFEVPGTELPNGTVAQVVQPGYKLHDRLLRPARVGVAKSVDGGDAKVDTTA